MGWPDCRCMPREPPLPGPLPRCAGERENSIALRNRAQRRGEASRGSGGFPLLARRIDPLQRQLATGRARRSYGDVRLGQGRENAKSFLQENPQVATDIEARVKEVLGMRGIVAATDGDSD